MTGLRYKWKTNQNAVNRCYVTVFFEETHQSCCRWSVPWVKAGLTLSRGVCQGAWSPRGPCSMGLDYYWGKASNRGGWSQWGSGDMTTGWGEGGRGSRGVARLWRWATRWRRLPPWNQRRSTGRRWAFGGCWGVEASAGKQGPPGAGRALLGRILGVKREGSAGFRLHQRASWMRFLAIRGGSVRAFSSREVVVFILISNFSQMGVLIVFLFIWVNWTEKKNSKQITIFYFPSVLFLIKTPL